MVAAQPVLLAGKIFFPRPFFSLSWPVLLPGKISRELKLQKFINAISSKHHQHLHHFRKVLSKSSFLQIDIFANSHSWPFFWQIIPPYNILANCCSEFSYLFFFKLSLWINFAFILNFLWTPFFAQCFLECLFCKLLCGYFFCKFSHLGEVHSHW